KVFFKKLGRNYAKTVARVPSHLKPLGNLSSASSWRALQGKLPEAMNAKILRGMPLRTLKHFAVQPGLDAQTLREAYRQTQSSMLQHYSWMRSSPYDYSEVTYSFQSQNWSSPYEQALGAMLRHRGTEPFLRLKMAAEQ